MIALRDVSDLRGLTRADDLPGEPRRADRARQSPRVRAAARGSARSRARAARGTCCATSTSTASRPSTTNAATSRATACCARSPALIKEAVRDSDTVGRLGGDEFGILLVGCPLEKARQIADDVVRAVNDHRFVWKDKIFSIGVSIGLVEVTRESTSIEDLHRRRGFGLLRREEAGRPRPRLLGARRGRGAPARRDPLAAAAAVGAEGKPLRAARAADRAPSTARRTGGPGLEVLLRLKDDQGVLGRPGRVHARGRALSADAA